MNVIPQYERGYVPTSDGAHMPYLIVGSGPVPLVLIPGASDGLRTVYDWAAPAAWALRERATHYCTLVISRREPLPPEFSAEQHADDFIRVIEDLGRGPALRLFPPATEEPPRRNLLMAGAHIAWGAALGRVVERLD